MRRFLNAPCAAVVIVAGCAALTGRADAAPCDPATPTTTDCTLTGTASLLQGVLSLAAPSALTWSATLDSRAQSLVDVSDPSHEQYEVDDASGNSAGWHVTTSATTFTTGGGTPVTLADTGTFQTTGSVTSATATTAPDATCAIVSTCTLPTGNTVTYPVAITTAATTPTPVSIYSAAAASGIGDIIIGGSTATNPVGWWLNIPFDAAPGTYTSTITMAIVSGP